VKIMLTGATGMVGRNIMDTVPEDVELLAPTHKELDLLNTSATRAYIEEQLPDVIIHAAGVVGGIEANMHFPVRFLTLNTMMGQNVVLGARDAGVPYLINLGSSCMYPRDFQQPLEESYLLQGELEPTNEGYALAKIYTQRLCSYVMREKSGLCYKTLIPCNLYGKYDKFYPPVSHMVPAVIRRLHQAVCDNMRIVPIWGTGEARREFMYAADLAHFIWFSLGKIGDLPEVMNVGLGTDYSIETYYREIAVVVGYGGEFSHDTSKPEGMKQKLVDTSAQQSLGWMPPTSLTEGLKATYNWYLANVDKKY